MQGYTIHTVIYWGVYAFFYVFQIENAASLDALYHETQHNVTDSRLSETCGSSGRKERNCGRLPPMVCYWLQLFCNWQIRLYFYWCHFLGKKFLFEMPHGTYTCHQSLWQNLYHSVLQLMLLKPMFCLSLQSLPCASKSIYKYSYHHALCVIRQAECVSVCNLCIL